MRRAQAATQETAGVAAKHLDYHAQVVYNNRRRFQEEREDAVASEEALLAELDAAHERRDASVAKQALQAAYLTRQAAEGASRAAQQAAAFAKERVDRLNRLQAGASNTRGWLMPRSQNTLTSPMHPFSHRH